MATLEHRAEAALRVIRDDPFVDRLLLLESVVWPSQTLENLEPRWRTALTDDEIARMQQLAAEGLSHTKIGERIGRSRTTVTQALRRERGRASGVTG